MTTAETLLKSGKPAESLRRLDDLLQADPPPPKALFIAAEAHSQLGRLTRAAELYGRVPPSSREWFVTSRLQAAGIYRHSLGKLSRAVAMYKELVERIPGNTGAHRDLAELLSIVGQRWESVPHYLSVIQSGEFSESDLIGLANIGATFSDPDLLRDAAKAAPADPLVLLGLGVESLAAREYDEARRQLEQAIEADADLWEAHGRLGQCLVEQEDWQAMPQWQKSLPQNRSYPVPSVWLASAMWAEAAGDHVGAARCYGEVLKLDPTDAAAHTRLARIFGQLERDEQAAVLSTRARLLIEVQQHAQRVQESQAELLEMGPMIEALRKLGREWEAWGWARRMTEVRAAEELPYEDAKELALELGRGLPAESPWIRPSGQVAVVLKLTADRLPDWESLQVATQMRRDQGEDRAAAVRFEIVNEAAGIDFAYYNGTEKPSAAPRLVEVDGGGVGVLDYDADGWPDLWWTQGSTWPPRPTTRWLDRVYRNRGDGTFVDVTSAARVVEFDFSQGITVGDFNNDGFDDVIVANVGKNRWFRNQGDGTFEEITEQVAVGGEAWSSSLLLADINGDGTPDYYEVNYLAGDESRTRLCADPEGKPRICPPMMFDAAEDRLFLGRGDGTFLDVTEAAGVAEHWGRGLGISTLRDDRISQRQHLFVANDVTQNFLWWNDGEGTSSDVRFRELGVPAGLAVDIDGRAQACMGVAVEDFNGDGRLDFFVTNFYDEWNTLYLQQDEGLFIDATRGSGLGEASSRMLGFGTQPLDVNRDGLPDLVVTNGHLVNETRFRIPYRMPPQCFLNLGEGRFRELPAATLGDYFQGRWLGRGMAAVDYDRDGREDFAITHLYSPGLLVANRSPDDHHWLALSLRARYGARDAFGTRVTIVTASGRRVRELTAGSGYQASNERRLLFGLGTADAVRQLEVEWPSGRKQIFSAPRLDREYIVVEGERELRLFPR